MFLAPIYNKGQIGKRVIEFMKNSYLYRRFITIPRIKRYLYYYVSEEDKKWLMEWHKSGDVFKKTGQIRDFVVPEYSWKHGIAKF